MKTRRSKNKEIDKTFKFWLTPAISFFENDLKN